MNGLSPADLRASERAHRIVPQFLAAHWKLRVADLLDLGHPRALTLGSDFQIAPRIVRLACGLVMPLAACDEKSRTRVLETRLRAC